VFGVYEKRRGEHLLNYREQVTHSMLAPKRKEIMTRQHRDRGLCLIRLRYMSEVRARIAVGLRGLP
jgi:hypothetical protein